MESVGKITRTENGEVLLILSDQQYENLQQIYSRYVNNKKKTLERYHNRVANKKKNTRINADELMFLSQGVM